MRESEQYSAGKLTNLKQYSAGKLTNLKYSAGKITNIQQYSAGKLAYLSDEHEKSCKVLGLLLDVCQVDDEIGKPA